MSNTITAFLHNNNVLIWKVQDVKILRDHWRIMGNFIGALPKYPYQNVQLGLPLLLSPDEVTLLLELNVLDLKIYTPVSKPLVTPSNLVQIHMEDPACDSFETANWTYPLTPYEILRYAVFKDLWNKKYILTNGLKFGGDFLVYTSDPALVHSEYIAIVLLPQQPISIPTLCRIGTKVLKKILLCTVLQETIQYKVIQWVKI